MTRADLPSAGGHQSAGLLALGSSTTGRPSRGTHHSGNCPAAHRSQRRPRAGFTPASLFTGRRNCRPTPIAERNLRRWQERIAFGVRNGEPARQKGQRREEFELRKGLAKVTRLGFEPRQRVPKTLVLPLHHRVIRRKYRHAFPGFQALSTSRESAPSDRVRAIERGA